ncbi:OmpA family protein [Flavobacterium gelidilacus]|uniref:OmpA family protein n=1 Tax=Flavobacterium gelidilacus TaxID=206041 RepID=UPI00041B91C0|nr:OmpA family protein [Flavobacterium gelidilacus]
MKKTIALLSLGLLFFACKKDNDSSTVEGSKEEIVTENNSVEDEAPFFLESFDWTKISESSSEIGAFPYVTAPEGFIIWKDGHNEIAKNGMTQFSDFSKMIMYNGTSFYNAEGKKAELDFAMAEKKADFNQFKFDKSVDEYLVNIGAILLFKGQIPNEFLKEINKVDDYTVHKYIQGDPWNSDPIRHYALNHKNGKIMFQVWSNSAEGEVGVVELEGFKQTIKAPTASEMQKDIDAKGKAVLNINFDTDKATLKPDGIKLVDEIFILLSSNPNLKLSIEGHTDNTGSVARNKELSTDRANTVMYALAGKGISIKRLKASGFGSEKPLVANDSDENKAKNRRVELVKF